MREPFVLPTSRRMIADLDARAYRFDPLGELPPHEHSSAAIAVLLAGSFDGAVGEHHYHCDSGDILVLPADLNHTERIGPCGARSIILMAAPDASEGNSDFDFPALAIVRSRVARRLTWQMATEWHANDSASSLALEHLVEEIRLHLAGSRDQARPEAVPPGLHRAREFLEDSLPSTPSLDEVAHHAGISRAHLTRTFRRTMGCSVGCYLRQCRLDRVALMLRDTNIPISQIAVSTGFYDQSHLNGAFRRWVGCSPGVFRSMHRKSSSAWTEAAEQSNRSLTPCDAT